MSLDPETLRELGLRMAGGAPQAAALGFRMVSAAPEEAFMAVPHRPELVGDPETGVMSGGVVTTLIDHVCGLAVHSKLLAEGHAHTIATLDLRIDYMRAAGAGREVTARATCYKLGHFIAFVRAAAYDGDNDDPVATAQAAFAITQSQSSAQ